MALNVYLDSSAGVRLLLLEPGWETAREVLRGARRVTASTLLYAEMVAALAAAGRSGRLTEASHAVAVRRAGEVWERVDEVVLDGPIARAAGVIAHRHALRAADAVHLATALDVRDPRLVMVTWDRRLHAASLEAGLTVAPARV